MNRLARTLLQIAASAGLLLCGTAIAQTSQTITFAAITTRTLDNSPLALTATASSGLPVSFASSTPAVCTVSGATATLLATGSCTITASQAGDGTYSPATPVPRTFAVNKAVQTITFATISTKTLAQTPLALAATSNSGLTVAFSSTTPAVCTVSGATATLLTTGTCSIAANQAGDSYWAAATQVLRSFSVTKASQTITFATLANRTYSPTPFVVTGTSTSGLAVAFAGTTPTICTVATDGGGVSTVTMLAAGTCTVTANQAGNATYNAATQISRSFTISKASQTLVIDTIADKNLGDADFQPDVTNSAGLPYILSTTTTAICTVANNAVTLVATGTCTVKADAPATPAYNAATQQSKSFTVAAARAPLVYYVHPDHIGSPRVMTKATDNSIVWKWDNEEVFGDNLPNEKPSGTGERFKYDLRFAGQVYDKETNTAYNYFRDYVPAGGGYQQSDLIGLRGGINTYAYVGGNPLSWSDPTGRFVFVLPLIPIVVTGTDIAIGAGLGVLGYGLDRVFNSPAPEPPVPGAVPHGEPVTGSGTRQWQKPGTAVDADRDFDGCTPSNVQDKGRGVRVGTLPNGDRIVVRPESASGQPTIEIQRPDGKRSRDKIRYGP